MTQVALSSHPGHAALRRGRCSIPGQVYLVTTTTFARQPLFARWPVGVAVAREVGGRRLWRGNQLHAWVLMPDHMHLLLTLNSDESLSHLMTRVKAVSARAARSVTKSDARIWADAFHDHALRRDEQVAVAAGYILDNPVRAGLVDDRWRWSFWDSEWLSEP
ncbi:MAG: REP-associated tyrosine transposase [Rhodanobacteraceae bacterium]